MTLISNYLRKSKEQTVSMFLIIFVASALMSVGALTLFDYGDFVDKKARELNAPHMIALVSRDRFSPAHMDFLKSDPAVTKTCVEDALLIDTCSFSYGGGKNTQAVVIQNADIYRDFSPFTLIGDTIGLTSDSIYAPFTLSAGGGYAVGDSVTLEHRKQEYTFTIAGFVEDLMLGATNMGVMGFYMPEPLYKRFEEASLATPIVLISARLTDPGLSEEVSNGFMAYCNEGRGAIWGFSITMLKMARTMITGIVSMMLVAFALIITVAALIVIYFRVNDMIRDDMKDFGILKSMGYTNRQIMVSVAAQFLAIASLAGALGIFASYLVIPLVSSVFESLSGLIWKQGFSPGTSAGCLVFIIAAVFLNLIISLRRVKALRPIMAIRGETGGGRVKKNWFSLEANGGWLNAALAGKLLMENLKQNCVIAVVIAATTFASSFGLTLYYNMSVDSGSFIQTVGGELSSVMVLPFANINAAQLREEIEAMPGVRQAIFFDSAMTLIDGEEYSADITSDFDRLEGQMLYEGSHPKTSGEVAIGGLGARSLGKTIGDSIEISRDGTKARYVITGFIQSGNFVGKQLFITDEGFSRLVPDFTPTVISIYLEDGEPADLFIEALENDYGGAISEPLNLDALIEGQTRAYVSMTAIVSAAVLVITAVIVFLILYFVIKTMISRGRRRFGVQKALGFTTYQIMRQIAMSFLPVALTGALAGVILGFFFINPLVTTLFSGIGVMRFDMVISPVWLGTLCAGMVLLSYTIAMVISARIRDISAIALVTE